jgi:hypothetical protein
LFLSLKWGNVAFNVSKRSFPIWIIDCNFVVFALPVQMIPHEIMIPTRNHSGDWIGDDSFIDDICFLGLYSFFQ